MWVKITCGNCGHSGNADSFIPLDRQYDFKSPWKCPKCEVEFRGLRPAMPIQRNGGQNGEKINACNLG